MIAQQYSNIQLATPIVTAGTKNLNFKYGKSKAGLLKILSVVTGFIAVYLSAYAYDNALYAKPKYGAICTFNGGYAGRCEIGFFPQDDLCKSRNKLSKQQAERIENFLEKDKILEQIETCPSRWLVVPQIYVIGIIWGFTLITFIAMMISERKVQTFQKLDLIGHIIAALLVIVSGLCFIGYSVTVMVKDECKKRETKNIGFGGRSGTVNVTAERRQHGNGNRQSESVDPNNCDEAAIYKHMHILFAGIFSIFTGIVYILVGAASSKVRMGQQMIMEQEQQQQQQQQYFSPSQQVMMQATPSQQVNPFQSGYTQPAQPGYPYSQ